MLRTGAVVRRFNQPLGKQISRYFSSEPSVIIEKQEHVAVMRLNRPKVLNAMTVDLGEGFKDAVAELREDCAKEDIRAVIVTGNGRAFSAGGDMQFLRDRHHDTPANNAPIMRAFYERFLCVRTLPVPVIAAINGHAVGAGLCFALACDIRLAAANAKLGLTFVGLGLHPGMASTHFLPLIVGPQVASQMLLTGELISGTEAERKGVVAEAVDGDVMERAMEMANQIAKAGPIAVQTCVRSLRTAQEQGLERAVWREADAQAQCYASTDYLEGVNATAEKRAPGFTKS